MKKYINDLQQARIKLDDMKEQLGELSIPADNEELEAAIDFVITHLDLCVAKLDEVVPDE